MGGSSISWTICKSFKFCFRQITTPATYYYFYMPHAFPDAKLTVSKHWRQMLTKTQQWIVKSSKFLALPHELLHMSMKGTEFQLNYLFPEITTAKQTLRKSHTDPCPYEHAADGHRLAKNSFTMFIQVFRQKPLYVHLQCNGNICVTWKSIHLLTYNSVKQAKLVDVEPAKSSNSTQIAVDGESW